MVSNIDGGQIKYYHSRLFDPSGKKYILLHDKDGKEIFRKTGKFLVKQGIQDFLKTNTSPNVFIFSFPTSYYGDLP